MAIELPPKKYYSFNELAVRFNCRVHELLHFVIERQIMPSFYLVGARYQENIINHDEDYDGIHLFASPVINFDASNIDDVNSYQWLNGFYYLVWMQRTGISKCEFNYISKSKEQPSEGDVIYSIGHRLDLEDVLENGVVMAEELARFESTHRKSVDKLQVGDAVFSRWPWGDHHTELLGHLDAAARRYWGARYDPSDTSTASTNATVSEWLQIERKVSRTMADSIASMLRPDGLPTGPRK